jgi:heme/copper-type cytochrome/quinol oxidase subunit 2
MTSSAHHTTNAAHGSPLSAEEHDVVDSIVPMMPLVLPVAGAVLIFLLAFIAVYLA